MWLTHDETVLVARLLGNHLCTDEKPEEQSDDHKELQALTSRLLDHCTSVGAFRPGEDDDGLPPLDLVRFGSVHYPGRLCFKAI